MKQEVLTRDLLTIATIQINRATGDLLIKPIDGESMELVTVFVNNIDDSPAYLTKARGRLTVRRIARLLDTIGSEACELVQHGDMTECLNCCLHWDTNDANPPTCGNLK